MGGRRRRRRKLRKIFETWVEERGWLFLSDVLPFFFFPPFLPSFFSFFF